MTTDEQFKADVQSKADELSKVHGNVTPIVFIDTTDETKVVGYLKELPFETKLRIMDSTLTGAYSACDMVLSISLIPDVSDERILKIDNYRMGAINELYSMVKMSVNQFKKK